METYDRAALLEQLGAHGGNRAKTRLTEAEWVKLVAAKRHGSFVLIVAGESTKRGPWLQMIGAFELEPKHDHRVRVMSHTDWSDNLRARVAAAFLES